MEDPIYFIREERLGPEAKLLFDAMTFLDKHQGTPLSQIISTIESEITGLRARVFHSDNEHTMNECLDAAENLIQLMNFIKTSFYEQKTADTPSN